MVSITLAQVLFPALQALKSHPSFVAPTIHEPFLRRYQVLPGRTHPEMQGMASGGLVLSCIRVLENEEAQAVSMARKGKKRAAPSAPAAATAASATQATTAAATEAVGEAKEDSAGEPERKRAKLDAASELTSGAEEGERIPVAEAEARGDGAESKGTEEMEVEPAV